MGATMRGVSRPSASASACGFGPPSLLLGRGAARGLDVSRLEEDVVGGGVGRRRLAHDTGRESRGGPLTQGPHLPSFVLCKAMGNARGPWMQGAAWAWHSRSEIQTGTLVTMGGSQAGPLHPVTVLSPIRTGRQKNNPWPPWWTPGWCARWWRSVSGCPPIRMGGGPWINSVRVLGLRPDPLFSVVRPDGIHWVLVVGDNAASREWFQTGPVPTPIETQTGPSPALPRLRLPLVQHFITDRDLQALPGQTLGSWVTMMMPPTFLVCHDGWIVDWFPVPPLTPGRDPELQMWELMRIRLPLYR